MCFILYAGLEEASDMKPDELADLLCGLVITSDKVRSTGIKFYFVLSQKCISNKVRVPTRTGKPGKIGRHFPVREKSGNFEQTGKVRENHTKYWKTEMH